MEENLWMATSPGTDEEEMAAPTDPDLAEIYNLGHRFLSITHLAENPTPINKVTRRKNAGDEGMWTLTQPVTIGEHKKKMTLQLILNKRGIAPGILTPLAPLGHTLDRKPLITRISLPLYMIVNTPPTTNNAMVVILETVPILSNNMCLDLAPEVATRPLMLNTETIPNTRLARGDDMSEPIRLSCVPKVL